MACKKHKSYKAIKKPTAKCKECDCMYEEKQKEKKLEGN